MPDLLATPTAADLDRIYTDDWKDRIRDYFFQGTQYGDAACRYWAFSFDQKWAEHRARVAKDLKLARLIGHWMPLKTGEEISGGLSQFSSDENGTVPFPRATVIDSPVLTGRRVLVMGCGLGAEAIAYALHGADVTAIDLDAQAIELTQQLAARYGVSLQAQVMDATRTSFADGDFDLVSCSQVLEHLPPDRQPALVDEMGRVCKPGGLLWLDTPNQHSVMDAHDTGLPLVHWLPRRAKLRLARWLRRDVPTKESAFGFRQVGLHHYVSYFRLLKFLADAGRYQVLSRYHGFADADHYAQQRRWEGRRGRRFALKVAALRILMRFWNFNWLSGIHLVIRKLP